MTLELWHTHNTYNSINFFFVPGCKVNVHIRENEQTESRKSWELNVKFFRSIYFWLYRQFCTHFKGKECTNRDGEDSKFIKIVRNKICRSTKYKQREKTIVKQWRGSFFYKLSTMYLQYTFWLIFCCKWSFTMS